VSSEAQTKAPATLTRALLGSKLLNTRVAKRLAAWPDAYRTTLTSVVLASIVFVPYLGAVGLWDCWETHYGEVAREMIARNDYVHPWWESAWFFSKPAFTMWMQALGMQGARAGLALPLFMGGALLALGVWLFAVAGPRRRSAAHEFWGLLAGWAGLIGLGLAAWGLSVRLPWKFAEVTDGDGALPLFLEWGFRLPFAGFSILAVGLLTYALTRTVSARAGLATAVVLVTMPLYFLLSRQAVTDTPIVSATVAGIACALVAMLDAASKRKTEWWYAAYVFFGVATLAKGWLGFLVPGAAFAAYALLFVYDLNVPPERQALWAWRVMGKPPTRSAMRAAPCFCRARRRMAASQGRARTC
jgi:4-amino-4-deoxy-L-arabinose transferase-like glycosyltransferase